MRRTFVDVLATYAADIRAKTYYVARNEFDFDKSIPDAYLSQKYYPSRDIVYNSSAIATPSSPSIIIETVSAAGTFLNVMTPDNFIALCDKLWALDLSQLLYNPLEAITRTFMLPYSPATLANVFGLPSQTVVPLGIGALNPTGYSGYGAQIGSFRASKNITSINMSLTRTGDDWRNKDDHYITYIPYCGTIDIAGTDLYHTDNETTKNLYVDFYLDIVTGEVTAALNDNISTQTKLHYISGNMAISVPMSASNTAQRFVSGISGLVSTVAGAATSTVASPLVGASMIVQGAGSMLNALRATTSIVGNLGSTVSWTLPQFIYSIYETRNYAPNSATYAHARGLPLCAARAGSALSGYTVCENVDIHPAYASENACAEIKTLLESGVYF